jgi:hypothetical protein
MLLLEENNVMTTFYSGFLEWDALKVICFLYHILATTIGPCLLYGILWYELNSGDLQYRTILNQLMSHCCLIEIISSLTVKHVYLSYFIVGPFSYNSCDLIICVGNIFFVSLILISTTRHFVKFLYIFQWKHIISLDDDFVALFSTMTNLLFSILITFSNYFLGYQNDNIFFHICTGNHPAVNINRTRSFLSQVKDQELPEWLTPDASLNPLDLFVNIFFIISILITFMGCWYSYKHERKLFWKNFKKFVMCQRLTSQVGPIPSQVQASRVFTLSEEKFEENNNQVLISITFYEQLCNTLVF